MNNEYIENLQVALRGWKETKQNIKKKIEQWQDNTAFINALNDALVNVDKNIEKLSKKLEK